MTLKLLQSFRISCRKIARACSKSTIKIGVVEKYKNTMLKFLKAFELYDNLTDFQRLTCNSMERKSITIFTCKI